MWFNVDKLLFIPLMPKSASCFYIWLDYLCYAAFSSLRFCSAPKVESVNICFSVLGCNLACRFRDNRRELSSSLFAFSAQLQPFVEQQRRLWDVRQKKGNEETLSGTNLLIGQIGFPGILSVLHLSGLYHTRTLFSLSTLLPPFLLVHLPPVPSHPLLFTS